MFQLSELKEKVPAAFRTKEEGAAVGASPKYQFMTTMDIINILATMNWHVYVATQQKTKKNPDTTKHLIRFRNSSLTGKGGDIPEILLINSHDRTSPLTFHLGIFRLICSNGLVIADKTFAKYTVRHMHTTFETVTNAITNITNKIPDVFKTIKKFEGTILTREQQMDLAIKALAIRYPETLDVKTGQVRHDIIRKSLNLDDILKPQRKEDEGDNLWVVGNRIQEYVIKGGFKKTGAGNKPIQARELTNIKALINVNTGLWELFNEYCPS
jgi:hypothetical protein